MVLEVLLCKYQIQDSSQSGGLLELCLIVFVALFVSNAKIHLSNVVPCLNGLTL